MPLLKLKRNEDRYGGSGGAVGTDVFVDGKIVGYVTKRGEWYGNLGHRGVGYTYFDFYAVDAEGKDLSRPPSKVASGSKRREAVAEALVILGHPEAACEADADHADFHIRKLAER